MSTSQTTIDFLLDQLGACGAVTARKMFGEYCLYLAGRPVGLVCDNQLFLKNTQAARALMSEPLEGTPYPGAKPHLCITADQWEERDKLCQWVRATAEALSDAARQKPTPSRTPRVSSAKGRGTR